MPATFLMQAYTKKTYADLINKQRANPFLTVRTAHPMVLARCTITALVLATFRIAAVQTGHAAIHAYHCLGVASHTEQWPSPTIFYNRAKM